LVDFELPLHRAIPCVGQASGSGFTFVHLIEF